MLPPLLLLPRRITLLLLLPAAPADAPPSVCAGFISPDNKGKDIYVHKTAVLESHIRIEQLVQGQRLRFDVSERQVMDKKAGKPSNRPVAVNLSLLPPA